MNECKYCDPIIPKSHLVRKDRRAAVISDWKLNYDFDDKKYYLENSIIFKPKENIKYSIENHILINYCPQCGRKLGEENNDGLAIN